MTFAISRSTILTRSFRSSWWKTIMSSNRFKNSGLNTRFDSSRILSRIASYDPWPAIAPKPITVWRLVDEVRGRVPEIYIALKPGLTPSKAIEDKVVRVIETVIGKIAWPKGVRIVPDMPKTRSGKIMRRVLASISNTMDIGDVTTLANPEIVEQIRSMVQGEAKVAAKAGPEDIKSFGQE